MSEANRGVASATNKVLVIDFGAQYAQLIARRVREHNIFSELVRHTISAAEVKDKAPVAIILSGGPASVNVENAPQLDPEIYELGVPILGICYGAQLIAQQLGGTVGRDEKGEYGRTTMSVSADCDLLNAADADGSTVWMSHFDRIEELPDGFTGTGSTPNAPVAVLENPERKIWGVQYHPEVNHTDGGFELIGRFLTDLAEVKSDWTMDSVIDSSVAQISELVGDGNAICGLSGGVDSAVAAALVHKAIGDRLTCIYVDTGLMRSGETDQVVETFETNQKMKLISVDAKDRFLNALEGVSDPEKKRKIIGEQFIRVFEETAKSLPPADFLVQGTLYPDVIESGTSATGTAAKIKSHHNVGGLPDDLSFDLIEPLRNLFKDEVRKVGTELGLPDEIVWRQPFPGPGLAVRIIGEITAERVATLQAADLVVQEEVRNAGLYRELWQSFAVLADIRSVGVMGDERTYAHPIILRAVTSDDVMTADWARLPYDLLETISNRIINEVDDVNRVVYDITSKPPGTIEWE